MKRVLFLVGAALVAALGCQLVAGLEDRTFEDALPDASLVEAGGADTSPQADSNTCDRCGGTACVDLVSDPNNCGYCGHACQGCAAGLCPVTSMATFTSATALGLDANNVYVSTLSKIFAVDKAPPNYTKTTVSNFGANSIAGSSSSATAGSPSRRPRATCCRRAKGSPRPTWRRSSTAI